MIKLLKRLTKYFIIILIIITIILGVLIFIKDEKPPVYLNDFDYTTFDEKSEILINLDIMALTNLFETKQAYVNEETINKLIYQKMNGFDNKSFDVIGSEIRLKALWTEFRYNELNLYALINYKNVDTTVSLYTDVLNEDGEIQIQTKEVKVGQLPLPKTIIGHTIDRYNSSISNQFEYGDLDINDLTLTIATSHITTLVEETLNNDLFIFESARIGSGNLIISYRLNPDNLYGMKLMNVLNEIKRLINDPDFINNIFQLLDLADPNQAKFQQQFSTVMDLLQTKMKRSGAITFTKEENQMIDSLSEDFHSLPQNKQKAVVDSIESQMNQEVVTDLNEVIETIDDNETLNASDFISRLLKNR